MRAADLPPGVERDVPLAALTTLGVGGAARWFMRAGSSDDIVRGHQWAEAQGLHLFVLGGGSNLVVADAGIDGLVLQIASRGFSFAVQDGRTLLTAAAGEPWDDVVAAAVARGLAGLECLSGIPGTTGGTPIQNVGAYGQEVSDTITSVSVYDRQEQATRTLSASECAFSYRMSRFKQVDAGRFIVSGVSFSLTGLVAEPNYRDIAAHLAETGKRAPTAADVRNAVLAVRRTKGMVLDASDPDTRSVGSFFMNPLVTMRDRERVARTAGAEPPTFPAGDGVVKVPAAWLIERSGFPRGFSDGPVGVSSKHTLALTNRGGATARDVLRLAARIKREVADRFGVRLRPEPIFAGSHDDPNVEYLKS